MADRPIVLGALIALIGMPGQTVRADYVNPPGWENDTDFTHQTWGFDTDSIPLAADGGCTNAFGDPALTDVFLANPAYMFWVWENMVGGTRYGQWGGMTFNLAPDETAIALTFSIPNYERPEPWSKQLWIQVVYWGDLATGGQVLTVEIARDPAFQDVYLVYDTQADDIEDQSATGGGSTGQYWRFTRAFSLGEQPNGEYVRVSLVPAGSMAVFFDQVSVDTRAVVPGDFDDDADADLDDFAEFQPCFTGPNGGPIDPGCSPGDMDVDGDVDMDDFELYPHSFTGPLP